MQVARELFPDLLGDAEAAARARGLPGLRPQQAAVLSALSERRHVFAALPTGYGKSLCSWMPAAAWGWRVWVISPLVSLIQDQAMACRSLGVRALAWRAGLAPAKRRELFLELGSGSWQVCFLSPERFTRWASDGTLRALAGFGGDADLLVLDEMHCLEDWRGFRAGYRELAEPVRACTGRGTLLLGLSASFPEPASAAWMEELCGAHVRVSAGLGRENLALEVRALERGEERWLELLAALRGLAAPESALVYCRSRDEADDVARWLRSAGHEAVAYHAGLPAPVREARSRAFRRGLLRVVCATSAFGMGIDYPHVGRVVHFSLPRDLESYWQEVGRAGRGGQPARGLALWRRSEIARTRSMSDSERERFLDLWRAWAGGACRKAVVARKLGLEERNCGSCDRCVRRDARVPWWCEPAARLPSWVEERARLGRVKRGST